MYSSPSLQNLKCEHTIEDHKQTNNNCAFPKGYSFAKREHKNPFLTSPTQDNEQGHRKGSTLCEPGETVQWSFPSPSYFLWSIVSPENQLISPLLPYWIIRPDNQQTRSTKTNQPTSCRLNTTSNLISILWTPRGSNQFFLSFLYSFFVFVNLSLHFQARVKFVFPLTTDNEKKQFLYLIGWFELFKLFEHSFISELLQRTEVYKIWDVLQWL